MTEPYWFLAGTVRYVPNRVVREGTENPEYTIIEIIKLLPCLFRNSFSIEFSEKFRTF